jgi:aminoglycoside phosphotransferase (APT) family kinase protein
MRGMAEGATRPWSPDFELTREDAARLIAEQFPELRDARLEPVGHGWDNDAWLVGGELVFRFPRRAVAAVCMRNEIACLPRIAGALPLPVPLPTHVGKPTDRYPYPFAGYRWIEGRTACSVALDDAERSACAQPLAKFLRALHALPLPDDAPADPAGDKDVAKLVERTLGWLARVPDTEPGIERARAAVTRLAGTEDRDGRPRWVHGDLYARHLLLDERKLLSGVIDWGDVHAGEEADDLSIAYSFLPESARSAFFAAYGEVDPATRDRARLYALHCGAVLAAYGLEIGDRTMIEMGRTELTFATA